jgi:glucose/arabinose dehydrogenase
MVVGQLHAARARASLVAFLFVGLLAGAAAGQASSATGLGLPGGYESAYYYSGFATPITALTKDSAGVVTAATIDGIVRRLYDYDRDGVVDATQEYWSGAGLLSVTDILWSSPTSLYVCHLATITRIDDANADGVGDSAVVVASGLPVGFHQNNGILEDGPGHLLMTMGSLTDLGPESNPLAATILRIDVATGTWTTWATGIRNCFRLRRHPVTSQVFGGENEWNLHPTQPLVGDEINMYVQGGDYGYPNYFGAPPVGSFGFGPVAQLPPRLAPTGLRFNPNVRFSGYKDEMYMTLFSTGVGRVARVPIWFGPASGAPAGAAFEFASGFVNPIDVEFTDEGDMLVADFSSMQIHRIFQAHDCTLTIVGTPSVGTSIAVVAKSPTNAGALCYVAASHWPQPSLPIAPGMSVFLDPTSWLFTYSTTPGNGVFALPFGVPLNGVGEAIGTIFIPPIPSIAGLEIFLGAAILDAQTGTPLAAAPQQGLLLVPYF